MGWDNPPVTWRELQRRLSWDVTRLPAGPGERPAEEPGQEPGPGQPSARPGAGRVAPARNREENRGDMPPWAELHCHSAYSFLDGASSPAELVAEAGRQGVRALAITDHDGMYGVAQFAQAAARQAEQTGIPLQTIFGAELSLGCASPGGRRWPGGTTPRNPPAARWGAHRTPAARPGRWPGTRWAGKEFGPYP